MTPSKFFSSFNAYSVALITTAIAFSLTKLIEPIIIPSFVSFFFASVAISTWYGGLKPGLLSIVLALFSINYFFIDFSVPLPWIHPISLINLISRFLVFILVALIINLLNLDLRRSREKIQRLNQQLLQENQQRLKLITKAAKLGIWELDLNTKELSSSSHCKANFGLAPHDHLSYTDLFNLIHPDDRAYVQGQIEKAIAEHIDYQAEYRAIWSDGSLHWILARGQAIYENNHPVRMMGVTLDITQQKEAELAIQESDQKFRQLAENINEVFWMGTEDLTKIIYVSPAYEKIWQRSREELYANPSVFFDSIHPEDRQLAMNNIKPNQLEPFEVEYRILRPDGSVRWILDKGFPLYNSSGNFERRSGIAQDITDRKHAEIALKEANEALELRVMERTRQLEQELEERKRIENSLRESEERFRHAFDDAAVGMALVGLEGRWLKVNPVLCQMLGYCEKELFSLTVQDTTHPDDKQTELNYANQLVNHQIPYYHVEKRYFQKNGYIMWGLLSVSLICDAENKPLYFISQIQDITERKEAESVLSRLAAIVESSDDAIIGKSLTGIIETWNRGAEKLYGYTAEEIIGSPVSRLIPASHQDDFSKFVEKIQKGERIENYQSVRKHKDGRLINVSLTVSPIQLATGKIIGFSSISHDITEQKQIENTLQETNQRWRSLLENVQLLVIGLDVNCKIDYVNPFLLKLTGYTESEVIGENWLTKFVPVDYREELYELSQETLGNNYSFNHINPILTKSGKERIITWNNTVLRDIKGEITGTISIGEDITERQVVERIKSEFISIVSHELRTPLTSIRGSLGLLATGIYDDKPEKARRMIEIAVTDSERLVRLVNDILDLERLESGRVTLHKEVCDAASLMQQAVESVQAIATQNNITLALTALSSPVWAVPDMIIQALTNLLSNAIKFSQPGSHIWITAELIQDLPPHTPMTHPSFVHPFPYVLFSVKDQGRGIPPDKLEAIFGRFQQVDVSDCRSKGGTGLGLAICKSIIQQHDGQIWAASRLGEGSTFYFSLPTPPESVG